MKMILKEVKFESEQVYTGVILKESLPSLVRKVYNYFLKFLYTTYLHIYTIDSLHLDSIKYSCLHSYNLSWQTNQLEVLSGFALQIYLPMLQIYIYIYIFLTFLLNFLFRQYAHIYIYMTHLYNLLSVLSQPKCITNIHQMNTYYAETCRINCFCFLFIYRVGS